MYSSLELVLLVLLLLLVVLVVVGALGSLYLASAKVAAQVAGPLMKTATTLSRGSLSRCSSSS